jgi:hypothetical protein
MTVYIDKMAAWATANLEATQVRREKTADPKIASKG